MFWIIATVICILILAGLVIISVVEVGAEAEKHAPHPPESPEWDELINYCSQEGSAK